MPSAGIAPIRAPSPWQGDEAERITGGSRVHCCPISGLGTRLCPCGLAMATPQTFAMASHPRLLRPGQEFPARNEGRERTATQPVSTGFELVPTSRGVTTPVSRVYSSRLAHHARPVRQYQADVTLSRLLPPSPPIHGSAASSFVPPLRRRGDGGLSPPFGTTAPHGAQAVAEQPLRAGSRVRAQPVAHVYRQPDPPVVPGPAAGARPAPQRSRATCTCPRMGALYTAPCPRRHSGSSDSSAAMCTRSCLHSTASHTSARVSRVPPEAPEQLAAERREHPARLFPALPILDRFRGQAILKATATASTTGFRQTEPTVSRWPPAVTKTRQTTRAKTVTADSRG